MKKLLILVIVIILASTSVSFGQGRHSIKVGFGTNLMWEYDSRNPEKNSYSLGPTFHIDYGYKLKRYLELGVNVFSLTNHYGQSRDATRLGVLAKATFTPFPLLFRYVRLGVGIGWMNSKYSLIYPTKGYRFSNNQFAFDYYIRAYAIDNKRFELYGSYGLNYFYIPVERNFFWSHSNVSLHFGVKFR